MFAKATVANGQGVVGNARVIMSMNAMTVKDLLKRRRSEKVIIFWPMCVSLLFHLLKCWTYYEFTFHP